MSARALVLVVATVVATVFAPISVAAQTTEERILFSSDLDSPGIDQIYSVRADGTGLTNLTPDRPALDPDISPDGTDITYAISAIYVMAADGTGDTQLTFPDIGDGEYDAFPAWSPDGSEIAFVRTTPGVGPSVLRVHVATGVESFVAAAGQLDWIVSGLDWRHDGERVSWGVLDTSIFPLGDFEIFSAPPDGSAVPVGIAAGSDPTYAPNGDWLAFANFIGEIEVLDIGFTTQPFDVPYLGTEPAFSSDSGTLAFFAPNGSDNSILVFDTGAEQVVGSIPLGGHDTRGVAFGSLVTDGTPGPFDDVPGNHIFAEEITWLSAEEITLGCNPAGTLYCPDDPVTRGAMASFLARALDLAPSDTNRFTDDDASTHEPNIDAIADAAITLGCDPLGTLYCPDDAVTRGQMASFLARALDLAPSDTNRFTDDDGSTHEPNIDAIADAAITLGCDPLGTLYCPDDAVTRGQMAAFLFRALGDG